MLNVITKSSEVNLSFVQTFKEIIRQEGYAVGLCIIQWKIQVISIVVQLMI